MLIRATIRNMEVPYMGANRMRYVHYKGKWRMLRINKVKSKGLRQPMTWYINMQDGNGRLIVNLQEVMS